MCCPTAVGYRALVLPNQPAISLPVLRKVREFVAAGATVVGNTRPAAATGLADFASRDAEVGKIAGELWNEAAPRRVVTGKKTRDVLIGSGVRPDFECSGGDAQTDVSYIHRRDGATEIYFVASRGERPESLRCTFRVSGKAPELWNAVSGERQFADVYEEKDGGTTVPLALDPCGSVFVVFREPAAAHPPRGPAGERPPAMLCELTGPWTVAFDPRWGGPASASFDRLTGWETHAEPGIKFYSGTATYRQTFDLPAGADANSTLYLDLGKVRELAEVRLNDQPLGVVWTPPFRVNISRAVKPAGNRLEIDVVNFWPNRVIGDAALPPARRLTQTNIDKLTAQTPLMESGLIGPVRIFAP